MKYYQFVDGKTIQADSPSEFIEKMRASSLAPSTSKEDFMTQCSTRASKLGQFVSLQSDQAFVDSLLTSGIVRLIDQEREINLNLN